MATGILVIPSPIITPKPEPIPTIDPNSRLYVPSNTTIIEEEAFADIAAQEVFIPASTREIKSKAFLHCTNLKAIHFEDGNITVADDFLSGCNESIQIDAPEGSIVSNNEPKYREYLCQDSPEIDLNKYVTLKDKTNGNGYIPLYADEALTELLGYVKSDIVVISLIDPELNNISVYSIKLSKYDDIMYVSAEYVSLE